MKRPMTIRLPDDLRKMLDQISKEERLPVSDLVRESISATRRSIALGSCAIGPALC